MKFTITMKDPDGVYDSIKDQAREYALTIKGITASEVRALMETKVEWLEKEIKPWFRHGEYLTIENDTDAGTCTVCRV